VAAARVAGVSVRADATLTNDMGVRLAPAGDATRPTLAITLPGQQAPAVVIEAPEHAWGRRAGGPEQEWFYRLYATDAPPIRWTTKGKALEYAVSLGPIRLQCRATLHSDGVGLAYALVNATDGGFERVMAATCVKLYRPFTDVFLERTYVHHAGGLDLLASETPARLAMNAEEWLPCRYIARCEGAPLPPDQRLVRERDGTRSLARYTKGRVADAPFLATVAQDGGWVAATHTLHASSVFTNPARTCHHADPIAPLPARGTADLTLRLYLLRGTVAEAWSVVAKSRAAGHA
jgi:hypothetical protein